MLQTIRDKISGWVAKLLLGALVIVFVFWGIELRSVSSADNVAAEVNGDKISLSALQSAWQQRQVSLQQAFKGEVPDAFKKQQQEALLQQMIREQLQVTRASDMGFYVSNKDLAKRLMDLDALKVDGKFSRERYAAALVQQGMTEAQFESQFRTTLETQQLQNGIAGTAFITPKELMRARALEAEQRQIAYVIVAKQPYMNKAQASDADVQSYYDAHKSEYMTDESVDLQYVELNLADTAKSIQVDDAALRDYYEQIKDRFATAERRKAHHILITVDKNRDDAAAKQLANEILAKVNAGGDFEALAKQYSQDPGSATKGGDLGWASKGMYVGAFENALFSMKKGEVRGPIKTEFGYHIIRLDDVEGGQSKSFDEVREQVAADYKDEQARSKFYDATQKLADEALAKLTELDSIAKDFNTSVKTIAEFTRKGAGEFVGNNDVITAAFSDNVLDKGENSPLITIGEERALVLRVVNHRSPEQKSLADVKAEIVSKLAEQTAQQAVQQQAKELVAGLQSGSQSWAAVEKSLPANAGAAKLLERSAEGVDNGILQAAFAVSKADVSAAKPVYLNTALASGDYAVVQVSAVQPGSTDASAAAELRTLREQRISADGNNELGAYVAELERTAKVTRNPKAFD